MSNCYPVAGVISLKPLTGAQGGTRLTVYGLRAGRFYILDYPTQQRLKINNLPKVIPEAWQGLNSKCIWHTSVFLKPRIMRSPTLHFVMGVEAEILAMCGVAESHPSVRICNHLVPQTDQALFLQKWLSLYPRRMSSAGHHLGSILGSRSCYCHSTSRLLCLWEKLVKWHEEMKQMHMDQIQVIKRSFRPRRPTQFQSWRWSDGYGCS